MRSSAYRFSGALARVFAVIWLRMSAMIRTRSRERTGRIRDGGRRENQIPSLKKRSLQWKNRRRGGTQVLEWSNPRAKSERYRGGNSQHPNWEEEANRVNDRERDRYMEVKPLTGHMYIQNISNCSPRLPLGKRLSHIRIPSTRAAPSHVASTQSLSQIIKLPYTGFPA